MPQVERIGDNVIIRNVPIFDEHFDEDRPEALQHVDEAKLNRIIQNTDRRLVTEYELPLAAGWHNPKPGENRAPPPVKGGYRNLRLDDYTDADGTRKAIYCDMRVPVSEWKGVESLQRRSVEIIGSTLELDTCVLLGSKTPQRDLGRLTPATHYDRSPNGVCVRYEMNDADDKESPMDIAAPAAPVQPQAPASPADPAMVAAFMACLQSPEAMQLLSGMMAGAVRTELATALAEAPEGEQVHGEGGEEMPPELMGDEAPGGAMEGAEGTDSPPDEPAAPSGEDDKEKYERMERRDLKVQYERTQTELKDVKEELAKIKGRETSERYERQLAEMQAEGYSVQSKDEYAFIMSLPNDQHRDSYVTRLRANARKAPTGGFNRVSNQVVDYAHREDPVKYAKDQNPLSGELTEAQAIEVKKLARTMGWTEARAKVLTGS